MIVMNATKARANFYQIIKNADKESEPVVVTGKENNVVILSEKEFRGMQETLYLQSIPGMVESILEASRSDDCISLDELREQMKQEGHEI